MNSPMFTRSTSATNTLEINKTLKNTYFLLSMTLVTSAIAALATMAMGLSPMMALVMQVAAIGILFLRSTKKHQLIYGYRMDIRVYNIDGRRSWPNAEPLCVYS